jgi:hypothetical protein
MLYEKRVVTVDSLLWDAVVERAERDQLSIEAWLRRQLALSAGVPCAASADEADDGTFDLVLRHFRHLGLSRDEQQWLADTLATAIDSGESCRVGPIGTRKRHYQIQRRGAAVIIRAGEGRVSVPLMQAMQLVALLGGEGSLELETVIAA